MFSVETGSCIYEQLAAERWPQGWGEQDATPRLCLKNPSSLSKAVAELLVQRLPGFLWKKRHIISSALGEGGKANGWWKEITTGPCQTYFLLPGPTGLSSTILRPCQAFYSPTKHLLLLKGVNDRAGFEERNHVLAFWKSIFWMADG